MLFLNVRTTVVCLFILNYNTVCSISHSTFHCLKLNKVSLESYNLKETINQTRNKMITLSWMVIFRSAINQTMYSHLVMGCFSYDNGLENRFNNSKQKHYVKLCGPPGQNPKSLKIFNLILTEIKTTWFVKTMKAFTFSLYLERYSEHVAVTFAGKGVTLLCAKPFCFNKCGAIEIETAPFVERG